MTQVMQWPTSLAVISVAGLPAEAIGHAAAALDELDPDRVLVLCAKPAKASQHSHWLAARWLWMSRPPWPRTSASARSAPSSAPGPVAFSARLRWRSGGSGGHDQSL